MRGPPCRTEWPMTNTKHAMPTTMKVMYSAHPRLSGIDIPHRIISSSTKISFTRFTGTYVLPTSRVPLSYTAVD